VPDLSSHRLETAKLLEGLDLSAKPLGCREGWSPGLQLAMGIIFSSGLSMALRLTDSAGPAGDRLSLTASWDRVSWAVAPDHGHHGENSTQEQRAQNNGGKWNVPALPGKAHGFFWVECGMGSHGCLPLLNALNIPDPSPNACNIGWAGLQISGLTGYLSATSIVFCELQEL
jgi:hypothetical protein